MKKILIISFFLACIPDVYAYNPVMSLGIEGYAAMNGESFPSSETEPKVGGYQFEGGLYADLKILCSSDRGRYFHELYFSYGRSYGEFNYKSYVNRYAADTVTVLYRIGGFQSSPRVSVDYKRDVSVTPINDKFFMYAGAGFAVDRYRTGSLAHPGDSGRKPYLVRPVLCIGGGLLFERVTLTICEIRFDERFKSQPQREFNRYLDSHMMGAVGIYSSVGFNF